MIRSHGDDSELVGRCLSGEEEAWRTLHERFESFCREVVRSAHRRARLTGADSDVDETTQDFFGHLAEAGGRRLGLYRSEGPLRHYVAILATNFALARADEIHRRRRRERSIEAVSEQSSTSEGGPEALERAEIRSQFEAAVAALPSSDRVVFELLYRDGAEVETACRVLRVSRNALYIRKSRLKEKLRSLLAVTDLGKRT